MRGVDAGLEGTTLGRYRVDRVIGGGGMGTVYAGVQQPLGRPVAIKVLRPELSSDAEIVGRFKREAELAASLSHPSIAQVTDFGVEKGRAFIVMDLLDGESLADLLKREGRLSPRRVQRIAMQVLAALAMAHERGVVHRDLKPENVFVQRVSGMELVKLLDFGIARMVDADVKMTSTGAVLGTPAYMSPEQARGKKVDARSDVFSLGALLYEALSGKRPFGGENYHELMFAVVEQTPPRILDAPPALVAVVERAMNKTAEARFESAKEMKDALEALADLPDDAPRSPQTRPVQDAAFAATMPSQPRAPSPSGRSRWVALGVAGCALAIVGIGLGSQLVPRGGGSDPPTPPQPPPSARPPTPPPAVEAPMQPVPPATDPAPVPPPPVAADPAVAPAVEVAAPPRPAARPRLVTRTCRGGSETQLYVIHGRDEIRATSVFPEGGVRVDNAALRGAVDARRGEILRCYRGHEMLNGQDILFVVDAQSHVERVEIVDYCPVEPRVAACLQRIFETIPVVVTNEHAGRIRLGLSISGT
jgi:serine/threonine-protein kinase